MAGHPIPDPAVCILADEFAALPDCTACSGTGKDRTATDAAFPPPDLAKDCQGLLTSAARPTCLHVLANLLRRNGVVQLTARAVCPACLEALARAVDGLGLVPAVCWPAAPAPVGDWSYAREPEPDAGGFQRGVVRSNLAPGEQP